MVKCNMGAAFRPFIRPGYGLACGKRRSCLETPTRDGLNVTPHPARAAHVRDGRIHCARAATFVFLRQHPRTPEEVDRAVYFTIYLHRVKPKMFE